MLKEFIDENLGVYAYGGVPDIGVQSVYTGEFPGGEENNCGVAKWSGTSFATALVTGYMALLCAAGMTAEEAYEFLTQPFQASDQDQVICKRNILMRLRYGDHH